MKYTDHHGWVELVDEPHALVGISKRALEQIGEIVHIEFPGIGKKIRKNDPVCVLESTKSAIDVYSPLSGEIVAINKSLQKDVQQINHSDEKEGWIYKIALDDVSEYEDI